MPNITASIKTEDCEENEISVIPLLMKNKVPPGFEIDEKLDVSLRPDEVSLLLHFCVILCIKLFISDLFVG